MQTLKSIDAGKDLTAHENFMRNRQDELINLEKMRADLVADFPTAKDQIQKVDSMIADVRKVIKGGD